MSQPSILVFDSGLGGLTVYREVRKARPEAHFIYAADDAAFPYGSIPAPDLVKRVLSVMEVLIRRYQPTLVVIACNTASTLVLSQLRAHFSVPFVGTVPAIKPACAASVTKYVSVLGTEATVAREYTRALIRDFANGAHVTLVGAARLAGYAEAELKGEPAPDDAIRAEIAPCFVEEAVLRTDTVVLACTHYPLLLPRLDQLAPWPVRYMDPAPAIARRVGDLLGPTVGDTVRDPGRVLFTSGRTPAPVLATALAGFSLRAQASDLFDTPPVSA
jgi:glutamate racemase